MRITIPVSMLSLLVVCATHFQPIRASRIPGCVRDCVGMDDGDYQSCESCGKYITCTNQILMGPRPCAPVGLVWDDYTKTCERTSKTCHQQITIDDVIPGSTIDDAGVVQGSLDDDDIDAIHLELANTELLGGCKDGVCIFCTKKRFGVKFCFVARTIRLGFVLKFIVNERTIFNKEISVTNPPPICKGVPVIGQACVIIYKVDIKRMSACVRVEFKVGIGPFAKKIKLEIGCFSLLKREKTSPPICKKLLQELVDENLNSVE